MAQAFKGVVIEVDVGQFNGFFVERVDVYCKAMIL